MQVCTVACGHTVPMAFSAGPTRVTLGAAGPAGFAHEGRFGSTVAGYGS
jgi:hypothetical protein